MPSLVLELQCAAQDNKKSVSDLLRMVKVIAAKLGLNDITEWVEHELGGYFGGTIPPSYRLMRGGSLQIKNPVRGWQSSGYVNMELPCLQSVAEIERLAKSDNVVYPLTGQRKASVWDQLDRPISDWPQQIDIGPIPLATILDSIRNRILDWSLELEKRGIMGDNMSFKEQERQAAAQNITIQNFKGVLGNVSNSHVEVHDYSTIHQTLREHNVPQAERNEIENIIDDLRKAPQTERQSLLERGTKWIVKNKDFLGASAAIVRKALGLPETGD